jgi:thioredoxin reductase (NADPH)
LPNKQMNNSIYDTIIIGAGPAGLTAALYARRYKLEVLLLEKISAGGQIILSPTIENFPGFPGGIPTQELADRMKKQVDDLKTQIKDEEALEIDNIDDKMGTIFKVKTKEGFYKTKTIIIATGAQYKKLGVKGEDRLIGRGISYCGTCDGPMFKNKEIVLVGAGDRAIEEAIFLSGYAKKVTVIHRRDVLRASGILQEKASKIENIDFILDTVVQEVSGENKVSGVILNNLKTKAKLSLACEGVFIFVGISPNTAFLKGKLKADEAGFIFTDDDMQTCEKAIFACGDCRKKSLYQVVNACAEGAVAACSVQRYLL